MLSPVLQSAFNATGLPHTKHVIICLTPGVCLAGCKSMKETRGPCPKKPTNKTIRLLPGDPSIDV